MRYFTAIHTPAKPLAPRAQGQVSPHVVPQAGGVAEVGAGGRGQAVTDRGRGTERKPRMVPDRRMSCRRIQTEKRLFEVRSGVERRCGSRRQGEPTQHIRVKV